MNCKFENNSLAILKSIMRINDSLILDSNQIAGFDENNTIIFKWDTSSYLEFKIFNKVGVDSMKSLIFLIENMFVKKNNKIVDSSINIEIKNNQIILKKNDKTFKITTIKNEEIVPTKFAEMFEKLINDFGIFYNESLLEFTFSKELFQELMTFRNISNKKDLMITIKNLDGDIEFIINGGTNNSTIERIIEANEEDINILGDFEEISFNFIPMLNIIPGDYICHIGQSGRGAQMMYMKNLKNGNILPQYYVASSKKVPREEKYLDG